MTLLNFMYHEKDYINFLLLMISYYAESQCVMQLSADTAIQCGTQSIIQLKLPWRTIPSNVATHLNDVYFTSQNVGFVVGTNGVILKTTNKGEIFSTQNSGTSETLNAVFF